MTTSVGIVGAGLLGRTLAVELIKKNYRVSLFDRDDIKGEQSCAHTGAGMLAPYCELESSDPLILALGENSVSRWRSIIEELPEPVFLQQNGTLVVAHNADTAMLNQFGSRLKLKDQRAFEQVVWLNSEQLGQMEPSIAKRFDGAFYVENEGQIDNRQLLAALKAKLFASDCYWHQNVEVTSTNEGAVHTSRGEKHFFDFVVDCRGLGAQRQFKELRGVRGEMVMVHSPDVVLNRPVRVLHPRYAIYVVPRQNQKFLIGATSIECEDYSPISVLSTLELLSAAFSLNPAFATASVIETRVNCRPALPDNLPSIRLSPGLIEVNGLYRHGFLVTPSMVASVLDHIEGLPPDPALEKLFSSATLDPAKHSDLRRKVCNL